MNEPKVRRGSLVIILPLALMAAAYVWFVFLPTKRSIESIRQEIETKQMQVNESAGTARYLRQTESDLEAVQKYTSECRGRLTPEKDISQLYGQIHAAAEAAKVRITRFEPQPPVAQQRLGKVPLAIGCTGSFVETYDFLRRLESMPRSLWVSSVKMEKEQQAGRSVRCDVGLVIFADNSDISDYAMSSD